MAMRILGDGVAARCCAHLLGAAVEPGARARVPVILLSDAAQNLIRGVFGRDELFRELPRITKRVVKWGAAPVEVAHSAVVVSEEALLELLAGTLKEEPKSAEWTVCAAPPLPEATSEYRFGSRLAAAVKVQMKSAEDVCWIEAVDGGWLFLLAGWLLAVGASAEDLLEKSSLVRDQIDGIEGTRARFPSSPRIVSPLGGDGWIACGSAAMGFDPLCGDGTAHAVREAILASAVIRAAGRGEDIQGLMGHYEARLTAGFQRHLELCRQFYSSGGSAEWWKNELTAVEEGIEWCGRKLEGIKFCYRLEGLDLVKNAL